MIPLYEFFFESLDAYSTQDLSCESINYTMYVKTTTSTDPVDIYWNLDFNDYELNPEEFENRGIYTALIRSCVPVGSDKVCVDSLTWSIEVYDPCKSTEIISAGWNMVLTGP